MIPPAEHLPTARNQIALLVARLRSTMDKDMAEQTVSFAKHAIE